MGKMSLLQAETIRYIAADINQFKVNGHGSDFTSLGRRVLPAE